jgi:hypothetical protein
MATMVWLSFIWHFFVTLWHNLVYCKLEGSEQFIDETERIVVFFPEFMEVQRQFRGPGSIPSYRSESANDEEAEDEEEVRPQDDQEIRQPGQMDEDLGRITPEPENEIHENSSGFYRHPDGIIEVQIYRSRGRFHQIPKG